MSENATAGAGMNAYILVATGGARRAPRREDTMTRMDRIDESRPFKPVNIAVLTISDTRTLADDKSGDTLAERIKGAGHHLVARDIVTDDVDKIRARVRAWIDDAAVDVVITTGGTGVTGRDVTPEALKALFEKEIEGFGEVFRFLSFQKIGTATMQSRAVAGVANGTYIFGLPGSPGACRDGWDDILKYQLDIRYRPCNFAELMPRLNEGKPPRSG
jgi:molybdenum cofactor biosynthesis protein B